MSDEINKAKSELIKLDKKSGRTGVLVTAILCVSTLINNVLLPSSVSATDYLLCVIAGMLAMIAMRASLIWSAIVVNLK